MLNVNQKTKIKNEIANRCKIILIIVNLFAENI